MKFLLAIMLFASAVTGTAEFAVYDVFVDAAGEPLAAYQVKITDRAGVARILSIEGGSHPAFLEPPVYDPKALRREVIKLAAFSTLPPSQLPKGKVRVASLHLEAGSMPDLAIVLQAASAPGGRKIQATASLAPRIKE